MGEKTLYDAIGAHCAICALWPRLERIARLTTKDPVTGHAARGLSAFNTFTLGWFFGRYILDDPNLCDEHHNFINATCFDQCKLGGIILLESTAKDRRAASTSAEDVDLHEGRPEPPTTTKKRV